jgi:hypothetical protein
MVCMYIIIMVTIYTDVMDLELNPDQDGQDYLIIWVPTKIFVSVLRVPST